MTCPTCRSEIRKHWRFCKQCGAALVARQEIQERRAGLPEPSVNDAAARFVAVLSGLWNWSYVLIVFGLIAAAIAFGIHHVAFERGISSEHARQLLRNRTIADCRILLDGHLSSREEVALWRVKDAKVRRGTGYWEFTYPDDLTDLYSVLVTDEKLLNGTKPCGLELTLGNDWYDYGRHSK